MGADDFPNFEDLESLDQYDGWKEMYPHQFIPGGSDERVEYENDQFWIRNRTHHPRAVAPWDSIFCEAWQKTISENSNHIFPLPPSLGIDLRIVNGYVYLATVNTENPELLEEREGIFGKRSQYVFENFDELYEEWEEEARSLATEIEEIPVPNELPIYSSEAIVEDPTESTELLEVGKSYRELVNKVFRVWQHHYDYLLLAYLAYQSFREVCYEAFPDISDETIGKMISVVDSDLYKPDEKLNELAELAHDIGGEVPRILKSDDDPQMKIEKLEEQDGGEWVDRYDEIKDKWFYITDAAGLDHRDRVWLNNPEIIFDNLADKIRRLEEGEDLGRDLEVLDEERERVVDEYRSYLDEEAKEQFDQAYHICRKTYMYTEDHQFWIDQNLFPRLFSKQEEFGELCATHDLINEAEDIFMFNRYEAAELLEELQAVHARTPGTPVPQRWKNLAKERNELLSELEEMEPEPALGTPPEHIEDPFMEMLWGVTDDVIDDWLGQTDTEEGDITGFPASEGTVQGEAKVIESPSEINEIEDGDILVAPITNPSWAPVFPKIKGAVTDEGGVTSHAAIVCREYGVPAVTGTRAATSRIETGDAIRIDGADGTVELLED